MSDKIGHFKTVEMLHEKHFGTAEEQRVAKMLAEERVRANSEMALRFANLHMPEDIRSRARSWGMEAWAEVLWNNAFQCGYREAIRDRKQAATALADQVEKGE